MSIHFKEFPGLIWKNSMTPPGFDIDCNWTTRWHRHACTVPFSSCHGFCAELNPAQNPDIKIHDLAFMHVMAALLYRWKHSGVSALNQAQFAVYESVLKSWTWVYIFSWHFQDFWEILLYFPWFPGLEFDDLKFQVFQEVHEPRACQACPEEKCSKKRINNIQRVSQERNLQKELFPSALQLKLTITAFTTPPPHAHIQLYVHIPHIMHTRTHCSLHFRLLHCIAGSDFWGCSYR